MEFNGKDDYLSRWIHGICALLLVIVAWGCMLLMQSDLFNSPEEGCLSALFAACLYLAYRCARYAITGEKNINEEYIWRGR